MIVKPAYPRLNRSHSLSHGLIGLWAFSEGSGKPRDLMQRWGAATNPSGTVPTWNSSRGGWAWRHTALNARTDLIADGSTLPTSGGTVLMVYRKTDGTARISAAFGLRNDTAGNRIGAHLPYSDGTAYWDYGGNSSGTTRVAVAGLTYGRDAWAFTAGSRGMEIWQNGYLRGSHANAVTRTNAASPFGLGYYTTSVGPDLSEYEFFAVYNRQLTQAEVRQWSYDPFVILKKRTSWLKTRFLAAWAQGSNVLIQ